MIIREDMNQPADDFESFQFEDLQQKANQYLQRVRNQAQQIKQQAQEELDKWKEETIRQVREETAQLQQKAQTEWDTAHNDGYQKGFDQGLQDAREDIQNTVKAHLDDRLASVFPALDKIMAQLSDFDQQRLAQWQSASIHFLLAVAEKILRRQISIDPKALLPIIRDGLELTIRNQSISIRLSEEDYQTLLPELDKMLEGLHRVTTAEIVADTALKPGDCIICTDAGTIDLRIESQLKRIEEELN